MFHKDMVATNENSSRNLGLMLISFSKHYRCLGFLQWLPIDLVTS